MTIRVVKLPDIGEGVAEAEVTAWHVAVGDLVREDQPLADVMTDKATVEIPSPVSGTVVSLGVEAGSSLAVGGELVRLEVKGGPAGASEASASPPSQPALGSQLSAPIGTDRVHAEAQAPDLMHGEPRTPRNGPASFEAAPRGGTAPRAEDATRSADAGRSVASAGVPRPAGEKPVASPAVRGRARELGIDLRFVRGGGPAGRITHEDLDAFARGGGQPAAPGSAGRRPNPAVEEIKVIGLRRRIAQKMAEAKRRAAHFSYVDEVDVTAIEELRAALNQRWGDARPKLTLIPFLVAALVKTLPDFPQINALYDDEAEIVSRFGGVHVGIATQTPNGLMVPVVRHAEALDLWQVAAQVKRLADAARAGLAQREELSGSTITITSLGPLGGLVTTPVLNRPEVAIIGVNKQAIRPAWRDGAFVPRLQINLSASFDHRVVDGYDAARFVQALRAFLETPATLFMDG